MANGVRIAYLCVLGVGIATAGACVAMGHDSTISGAFIALLGVLGGSGLWEHLSKGGETSAQSDNSTTKTAAITPPSSKT